VIFSNVSFAQVQYRVSGTISLEDKPTGPADGVKVKFYNLPGMTPKDSTTTVTDGSYSIMIAPGYYLVEFTKTGYVPEEMGGVAVGSDTVLAAKQLIPGSVQEVAGNVAGTWTKNYVYYVTGELTIPTGQSLVIDPGVRVKFAKGTGLTANGSLQANGTEAQPIIFTSREATPLPGDWNGVTLNAPSNSIRYVHLDYATNGFVGSNANGTTIEFTRLVGTLANNSKAIYLENSGNLRIRGNVIKNSGWGIYATNVSLSIINQNTIEGTYQSLNEIIGAIEVSLSGSSVSIDSNNIKSVGSGIEVLLSTSVSNASYSISQNVINASYSDNQQGTRYGLTFDQYGPYNTNISDMFILSNKISVEGSNITAFRIYLYGAYENNYSVPINNLIIK